MDIQKLKCIIQESYSLAEVLRRLNLRPAGGNYGLLKKRIRDFSIDTSHFTGQSWRKGSRIPIVAPFPLKDVLVEDSVYQTNKLRKRLISEGLKEAKCEMCGNTTWNNKPIPLELNHLNGINTDHRIDNLQIVCPNCHAQTPNYRGKNKLSALFEKRDAEYRKFRESLTANPEPSLLIQEGAETRHDIPNP